MCSGCCPRLPSRGPLQPALCVSGLGCGATHVSAVHRAETLAASAAAYAEVAVIRAQVKVLFKAACLVRVPDRAVVLWLGVVDYALSFVLVLVRGVSGQK